MKREKSLVKNTIILSFGTLLPTIVNTVTIPILTGKLSATDFGTYDLIVTLVSLLLPIATLQIQSAGFRFLINYRGNDLESSKIISNIFAVTIPISSIVLIVMMFVLCKYPMLTRILICLYFFFDIVSSTLSQIARGQSYNKYYSMSTLITSISKLLFILITVCVLCLNLKGVLLSLFISSFVGSIYLFFKLKIYNYFKVRYIEFSIIKELLTYSWPMVPNNLSNWILRLSDRLIISIFLGVEANAIYAVSTKIPNLLTTFSGTFAMAWQENASIASEDNDSSSYYSKMFDLVFCFMAGVLAILIAATPLLFAILINGDYKEAYYQMPILFIAMLCSSMSSYLGGIYIAHKSTKSVGITTVIAAIINVIVNLVFIKLIGITAASISTLISYFILMLYRMKDIKKIETINYKYGKILIITFLLVVMVIFNYINRILFDCINMIIGILVAVLINKNMIKGILSNIKRKIIKNK